MEFVFQLSHCGKYINIGTTDMLRYDGEPIEWNGVLPDIRVPQSKEDIDQDGRSSWNMRLGC